MEIKINAIVPNRSNYQWSEIFGYTSKGQPGIEVIGLGSKGRAIKEKLTYLSKRRKLQFPVLRFVICAEGDDLDKCHSEYLELPILMAFWAMSGHLPIKRLDNCFTSGRVGLDGEIDYLDLSLGMWQKLHQSLEKKEKEIIYLGNRPPFITDRIRVIEADRLLDEAVGDFHQIDKTLARSTI